MKFLLASWGSSGDLHPFLALGRELRQRGHEVTMAGNPAWKADFIRLGIDFVEVGPAHTNAELFEHPEVISTKNFGLDSLKILMAEGIAPMMDDGFRVLCELAPEHDALVAHHFFLPAGAAAEKAQIPWATISLAPSIIPSKYTLPAGQVMQPFTGAIGRLANQAAWKFAKMMVRSHVDPMVNNQRTREGLAPIQDALFDSVSPTLNLLLFSEQFCPRYPDYAETIQHAGFCPWNPPYEPPAALVDFLAGGDKPWLFTLGSSVIANPGDFFTAAVEGLRGQKERAILLIGDKRNTPANVPDNVLVLDYAPYHWIMPRCRAVAHQCGMGTTAQALRSGIPTVACPYAFEQPHNAMCIEATGAGIYLAPRKRSAASLIKAMREVSEGKIAQRARELGEKLRAENGPVRASELLEKTFVGRPRPSEAKLYGFIEGLAIL